MFPAQLRSGAWVCFGYRRSFHHKHTFGSHILRTLCCCFGRRCCVRALRGTVLSTLCICMVRGALHSHKGRANAIPHTFCICMFGTLRSHRGRALMRGALHSHKGRAIAEPRCAYCC